MKIFVSTYPFGKVSADPIEIIKKEGVILKLNSYGRKIKRQELVRELVDTEILIAGTESLDREILTNAPKLKLIARVGIGVDGIDFEAAEELGIKVTYTPEAPTRAVAELTLGAMINLGRSVHIAHNGMKNGKWVRYTGMELSEATVGIIGFGRIGQLVAKLLQGFDTHILANDIAPDEEVAAHYNVKFCSKEEIYRKADFLSLHVPATPETVGMINKQVFRTMKSSTYLINTARSNIIEENDLYEALKTKEIAGAAIDVYWVEPYIAGQLSQFDNVLLSCHMGSCSSRSRYFMELGAAQEAVRFIKGKPLAFLVPEELRSKSRLITVPVNADFHQLTAVATVRADKKYREYRRRWRQYPAHTIVAEFPLCVDLDLCYWKEDNRLSPSDYLRQPAPSDSSNVLFMDGEIVQKVMAELKNQELVSLKLGLRGDPLLHREILDIIAQAKEYGCVEVILVTNAGALSESLAKELVKVKLDRLNIFANGHTEELYKQKMGGMPLSDLCRKLDILRHTKAIEKSKSPIVRIDSEMIPEIVSDISAFRSFWEYHVDEVALSDFFETPGSAVEALGWACSKLWQRIIVGYDGTLLPCNFDLQGESVLGHIFHMSIAEAWRGEILTKLRQLHKHGESHKPSVCAECAFRNAEIVKLA